MEEINANKQNIQYEKIANNALKEIANDAKKAKINKEIVKQAQVIKEAEKNLEREKQKLIKLNEKRENL
ncbi:hypothetical protein K8T27_000903 [Campylobacter upsaliensis]|uniref:Uncharacterized protein n=1 Tax=Campylobacter upsaliensis TaxID=28080 RepID=A0A5L4RAV8_CAMUP|nr:MULTISPECIES: hypothetical protein [Campylobacter]EAH7072725.1 hypothetical protein [Campylobacter upsaliensis]EAH8337919.1 hypothetical protein [Campylobacter upsaliensis]EAH8539798.1 hypothetical protein [Campylobacter upsaliensis]EAH9987598.1 hypothetical protein [Campylobacter upsaliensis]EAI0016727.1 hypothetical protein [Campylobacter upsaliensis]